jgi:ABC-type multidrug transport system fused ATPase/permease subunit
MDLRKIFEILTPRERGRALQLMILVFIMSLLDMAGIASIMPFMMALGNPGMIQDNPLLRWAYEALSFGSAQDFVFFLGSAFFVLFVGANLFKTFVIWAQNRFVYMREYTISKRLLEIYLYQPYEWFLQRHSAELSKTLLLEVQRCVQRALQPFILALSSGLLAVILLLVMIAVDPVLAIGAALLMGLLYGVLYLGLRGLLKRFGRDLTRDNEARAQALANALGGIKEVKMMGLEEECIARYAKPAQCYAAAMSKSHSIAQAPRYVIEAIAFGGMILALLYLTRRYGEFSEVLPIASFYALAVYRLIPNLQQLYGSLVQIRTAGPAIERLQHDLRQIDVTSHAAPEAALPAPTQSMELKNIRFCYPGAMRPTLDDINMDIRAHTIVALVGETGSGKTTVVDILIGLLRPAQGQLRVDGQNVEAVHMRAWQRMIGYVPQQIYLLDDTLAANIAFGASGAQVDRAAVEAAARAAGLHQFISQELPQGYETRVGERGVRLSGGQRQRVGIARALYRRPQLLVLDEATSALDVLTEQAVMEAIYRLEEKTTVVIIAHRLSTIRRCKQIFFLEKGRIVDWGSYDELVEKNASFRKMSAQDVRREARA